MTTPTLYEWPRSAHFGRVVPKSKFYEHAKIGSAVRDKFVGEVQRITWAYKLAEPTINLRSSEAVPEIQVFCIDAKDDDVSDAVLTAIDRSVRFPIIFEVQRGANATGEVRMVGAFKEPRKPRPMLSPYFSSSWTTAHAQRTPIPVAFDLAALYRELIFGLLPVRPRAGEQLSDAVTRVESALQLEREIASLERRLRKEAQLNRKVELRLELRRQKQALSLISNPVDLGDPIR